MGKNKLRKQRSQQPIASSGPALIQPRAVSASLTSSSSTTSISPISLATAPTTATATVTSDSIPPSGSLNDLSSIVGSVGSVGSTAGEASGGTTPIAGWSKTSTARSIRSVSSGDVDHTPSSIASQTQTTPSTSIDSNLPSSTSASALAALRERLSADEAARKHALEEEAERLAGPRKLQKKRVPSETSTPASESIKEEPAHVPVKFVAVELDEDEAKVTEMHPRDPSDEIATPAKEEIAPEKSARELYAVSWIPSSYIPSASQVVGYATGTVKSTASGVYSAATFVPFAVARRVPLVRSYVPEANKQEEKGKKKEEEVTTDPDLGEIAATAPDLFTAPSAGEVEPGLVYKSLEVGLGLGLASVLVGVAGAEIVYKKLSDGWKKEKPFVKAVH